MRYDAPTLRDRASENTASDRGRQRRRMASRLASGMASRLTSQVEPGQELARSRHESAYRPGEEGSAWTPGTDASTLCVRSIRPLVLVVDDEASLRALLTELLEEAGYAVITAGNGLAALSLLRHERPAVVLTDYTMPALDGPGLIQRLRNSPATRHIPIIAMSATRPPASVRGDVPFIEKPFDVDEVLEAIALHTAGPYTGDSFHQPARTSSEGGH